MPMRFNEFGDVILVSLLLTLFVIPAMYSFLSRKGGKGNEEMIGDEVVEEKVVSL